MRIRTRSWDACIPGTVSGGDPFTPDPVAALKQRVKPTYVRIWDEWRRNRRRRWATFRPECLPIADATVTSLHPKYPVEPELWSDDLNEISSAMLVGSGTASACFLAPIVPDSQWPGIAADFPGLGNHAAMKVPHHGSRKAVSDVFGTGAGDRCWIVTPFARQNLPRADRRLGDPGARAGRHVANSELCL